MSGVFFDKRARAILCRVAQHYQVKTADIRSKNRHQTLVTIRWVAMWLMYRAGGSTPQIGRWLDRDHTTVMSGLRQIRDMAAKYPDVRETLEGLLLYTGSEARSLVAAGAGL